MEYKRRRSIIQEFNCPQNANTQIANESDKRVRIEFYLAGSFVTAAAFFLPDKVMTATNQGMGILFANSPLIFDRHINGDLVEKSWNVWVTISPANVLVVEVFEE